jgi:hypothetical protein
MCVQKWFSPDGCIYLLLAWRCGSAGISHIADTRQPPTAAAAATPASTAAACATAAALLHLGSDRIGTAAPTV